MLKSEATVPEYRSNAVHYFPFLKDTAQKELASELGAAAIARRAALRANIEREIQQVLHSTFGYVQDDKALANE